MVGVFVWGLGQASDTLWLVFLVVGQLSSATCRPLRWSVGCFTKVTSSTPDCRPRKWGYPSPFVDEETGLEKCPGRDHSANTRQSWDSEPGSSASVLSL